MARNRNVSPSLWGNAQVHKLSWGAVPFYLGCISIADDEGRFRWDIVELANFVVGRRVDVSNEQVEAWMAEIVGAGLVDVYEVEGRAVAEHPNWRRYQYINKPQPSKLPHRDGSYTEASAAPRRSSSKTTRPEIAQQIVLNLVDSGSATGMRTSCSDTVPYASDSDSESNMNRVGETRERATPTESSSKTTRPEPQALEFRRWFVETGARVGAIALGTGGFEAAVRRESPEDAADLIADHGLEECERRARRLFAAHLRFDDLRIRVTPSIGRLVQFWNYRQLLSDDPSTSRGRRMSVTAIRRGPDSEYQYDYDSDGNRIGVRELVAS